MGVIRSRSPGPLPSAGRYQPHKVILKKHFLMQHLCMMEAANAPMQRFWTKVLLCRRPCILLQLQFMNLRGPLGNWELVKAHSPINSRHSLHHKLHPRSLLVNSLLCQSRQPLLIRRWLDQALLHRKLLPRSMLVNSSSCLPHQPLLFRRWWVQAHKLSSSN
jgi:hypothetical protein